ncbi:MAG: RNA polymerase sigma factor [Acidimicrobiia bacterium]
MQGADRESRFDRIFSLHEERVRRFCLRRLPVSDVNDAVADVFVVAWRRIDEAPEPEGALPWLYGVARNVVANQTRSRRRIGRLRARVAGLPATESPSAETIVVRQAGDDEVLQALGRLSSTDQELLRLKVWEDLSNTEIAEILKLSPNAVAVRLNRARNRLAVHLHMDTTKPAHRTTPVLHGEEAT